MSYRSDNEPRVRQWTQLVQQLCATTPVPPSVVLGLMTPESGGNPNAVSPMNPGYGRAHGLMQVLPMHFGITPSASMGYEVTEAQRAYMCDPERNISTAIALLARNYKSLNRWDHVAASYFGAYDWQNRRVTTAQDVTGTSGEVYVALFNECRSWYLDTDTYGDGSAPDSSPGSVPQNLAEAIAQEVSVQLVSDAEAIAGHAVVLSDAAKARDWTFSRTSARYIEETAKEAGKRLDAFGG